VPYSFDITGAVRRGEPNEIVVAVTDWVDCAQPDLQHDLAETNPDGARSIPGRPFIKPCGGEVLPAGIIESVWIYGHGNRWLSDIAVVTSTREDTITVRGVVHNDDKTARECVLRNVVFNGEVEVLRLPETTVTVNGGGATAFEVAARWEDPHLWWPDDPHLYRLQTTAASGDGVSDELSTRFGFREFRPDGDRFLLNETPTHLFAASSWPNGVPMGWSGRTRERWHDTKVLLASLRESGHDIYRAHSEPWSDLLADACDEVGLLLVTEGIMNSIPGKYAWEDPALMEHLRRFYERWPMREMNHPALVIRSIENEVGYLLHEGRMQPEAIPRVREGFKECGRIVRRIDPSRPIMYEGSGPGFYDVADIYNNHYPPDEYRWAWYPNSAYWPGREMDIYFTDDWKWDRQKPLYVGEWGWFPGGQDRFAAYMGPEIYRPGATYELAKSTLWRMGIEGMRYYGVSAMCPWYVLEGQRFERITTDRPHHRVVREGFAELKVSIRERGSVYFTGQTLTRTVSAYNDTLQRRELRIEWRVLVGGRPVASGRWSEDTPPAGLTRRRITTALPRGLEQTQAGRFEACLRVAGEVVSSATSAFRVFPRLEREHELSVAAIGLRSTHLRGLRRLGVEVRQIPADAPLGRLSVPLICGPRSNFTAADAGRLRQFVERGGQMVVIGQIAQPEWLPAPVDLVTEDPTTRYFVAWPACPLLRGLTESDFSFWPEDHVVSDSAWQRPDAVRYTPAIHGGVGLDTSPLARVQMGAGQVWLVQLPVWTSAPVNPVTEILGHNLLDELRRFRPTAPLRLGLIAPPASASEGMLADSGARPEVVRDVDELDLARYGVLIVEASAEILPEVLSHAGELQAWVEAGGCVWLHLVRPETAQGASRLCGREIALSDVFELPFIMRDHPLTAGLSEAQVYWSTDPANFRPVRPGAADYVANVAGGVALVQPPVLVEIPRGRGRFLVDQLHWESEYRNPDRARELLAGLCTNLGVALAPRERAARGPTFIAHFDGSARADLAAGKAEPVSTEGTAFVQGRFGQALAFTGSQDLRYEQRGNLDLNTGTLELWFRGSMRDDQILWRTTPENFNDADFLALWIWNGMLRFDHHCLPGGPGTGYVVHQGELSEGWHHIAATWDRAEGVALYLDGEQVAAERGTWEPVEPRFRHFTLSASHRPVTGAIDELRLLNYARSPEQIADDAQATEPFDTPDEPAEQWVPGQAGPG
ncbi:MAG: LamG-like jellyroll fold domain-containing protein, partial [Armatimonadota bacterium]